MKVRRPAVSFYPPRPLVPAQDCHFPMPCGPSTDQHGGAMLAPFRPVADACGAPLLRERIAWPGTYFVGGLFERSWRGTPRGWQGSCR
jgi:hypothetical protein